MTFRDKLMGTLRLLRPVLEEPGVLVVGSEVPNLLQPDAASTLVVSQDVDLGVPIDRVQAVKRRLAQIRGFVASTDEPSVYLPASPAHIEVNFLGLDARLREPNETYVLEDPELPLMVFGPLGLLRPGPGVDVEGLHIPLPRPADLIVEKLMTDRAGEKGARDLLVVAGLLSTAGPGEIDEAAVVARSVSDESRHAICSSLTVLSLMSAQPGMPNPTSVRQLVMRLLARIENRDD